MARAVALVSGRSWSQACAGDWTVSQAPGASQLSKLPILELAMGLLVVALCHVLKVGDEYSLGRAAVLFFFCGLIGAYGAIRNPYAPLLVYAFVTPILPNFGTGVSLIVGGTVAVFLNRAKAGWRWQFSKAGVAFCLWCLASLAWAERLYSDQSSFLVQALPPMILAFVISGIRDPLFRRNLVLLVVGACVVGSLGNLRNWLHGIVEFGGGERVYSFIRPDIFSAWELFGLMGAIAWLFATRSAAWLRCLLVGSLPLILAASGSAGFARRFSRPRSARAQPVCARKGYCRV
jgi:hypothetical protein